MEQHGFTPLLSVQVQHTYFEDGACNCIKFTPAAVTQSLFTRFNCVMRYNTGGFVLHINKQDEVAALLAHIKTATGETAFAFDISTTDPAFALFTDMPLHNHVNMVYNSGYAANTVTPGGMQLVATMVDDAVNKTIGQLIICFDDITKCLAGTSGPHYSIQYKARSTQWQYFIINKSGLALHSLRITNNKGIIFNGPENILLENGEPAYLFSTGDAVLPISEKAQYIFSLAAGSRIVIKSLPTATKTNVQIIVEDGIIKAVSAVYVYI